MSNTLSVVMGRALKVRARAGPGLEPFHKFWARELTGLQILLNKKLRFSGPFTKVGLEPSQALGPSSKVGLRAFQKTWASGRARAGLRPGPITKPDSALVYCIQIDG